MELDNIAALENLKAAIAVLSRHHGAAFPQMALTEDSGSPGFLQGWSAEEIQSVKLALKSAKSFMQSRQSYMPSYSAQSGEIFGVVSPGPIRTQMGWAHIKPQWARAMWGAGHGHKGL